MLGEQHFPIRQDEVADEVIISHMVRWLIGGILAAKDAHHDGDKTS